MERAAVCTPYADEVSSLQTGYSRADARLQLPSAIAGRILVLEGSSDAYGAKRPATRGAYVWRARQALPLKLPLTAVRSDSDMVRRLTAMRKDFVGFWENKSASASGEERAMPWPLESTSIQ